MNERKPAHQVITKRIVVIAGNLQRLEPMIKAGNVTTNGGKLPISAEELYKGKIQEIGGFCALCDVLQAMFIPPNALEEVIADLKKLEYRHAVLSGTIQSLEQRRPSISVA